MISKVQLRGIIFVARSRVLEVVQYETNPVTGEDLHFNESVVLKGLEHKSIKLWAYVRHDRDVFSEKDEAQNPLHKQGQTKPPHWHIVMKFDRSEETSLIAKWFNVPDSMVEIKNGKGAFLDCCFYLTHRDGKQQAQGKAIYEWDEIHCMEGFNLQHELQLRKTNTLFVAPDGKEFRNKKSYYRYMVGTCGMTLAEIKTEDVDAWLEYHDYLIRYRQIYIDECVDMPTFRQNFYICGNGRVGKDVLSRALAYKLLDPNGEIDLSDIPEEKLIFVVGGNKLSFEGYDGQRVVIWSDCRAKALLDKFGSLDSVLAFFDTRPYTRRENIKFGSLTVKNTYNIVNSVQSFSDFKSVLCKGEDERQIEGRFPMFAEVNPNTYDLYINRGVVEHNPHLYGEFYSYRYLPNKFVSLIQDCGDNRSLFHFESAKLLDLFFSQASKVHDALTSSSALTATDIAEKYSDPHRNHFVSVNIDGKESYVPYSVAMSMLNEMKSAHPDSYIDGDLIPVYVPAIDENGNEVVGLNETAVAVVGTIEGVRGQINLFEVMEGKKDV